MATCDITKPFAEATALSNRASRRSSQDTTMVHAHRLPTEVLCDIFLEATDGEAIRSIPISGTCLRWRDIILNYPWLWTHYDISNISSELLGDILPHSKALPLSFSYQTNGYNPAHVYSFDLIRANLPRTTGLDIRLIGDPYGPLSHATFLKSPAPVLEHMTLEADVVYHIYRAFHFFTGMTPRLKELILLRSRFPWSSFIYRGLVVLKIDCPRVITLNDGSFLDVLRACPNLEELQLFGAGILVTYLESRELIPLPHLRKLTTKLHIDEFAYILRHISTPADLKLTWYNCRCCVDDEPTQILPRNPMCLPVASSLHELSIDFGSVSTFPDIGVLTGKTCVNNGLPQESTIEESMHLEFLSRSAVLSGLLNSMTRHYDLTSVRKLRFMIHNNPLHAISGRFMRSSLINLFRKASNMTDLTIQLHAEIYPEDLLWNALIKGCKDDASKRPLFPALQYLTIQRMTLGETCLTFFRLGMASLPELRQVRFQCCKFEDKNMQSLITNCVGSYVRKVEEINCCL